MDKSGLCHQGRKFLKLPKIKQPLNIGKLGYTKGKLKQVRVVPRYGQYVVELIFEIAIETKMMDKGRLMAIDLGVDNLATIVTTTGTRPVLVKGKHIKAVNQYYNKMKAHYTGILRHGMQPREGQHTSRRLERLHRCHRKIKDLFHKASCRIVHLAVNRTSARSSSDKTGDGNNMPHMAKCIKLFATSLINC